MRLRPHHHRNGNTLLELVAASTIIALAVTPALRLMRDAISVGTDIELSSMLETAAADALESALASQARSWTNGTTNVSNVSAQFTTIKTVVVCSDAAADGGITNKLMAITATAYDDSNGSGNWNTREKRVVFATKLARMVSYGYRATP